MVHHTFEQMTKFGNYRDALHFSDAEWALLLPGQLEDKIQERVDAWVAYKEQEEERNKEEMDDVDAKLASGDAVLTPQGIVEAVAGVPKEVVEEKVEPIIEEIVPGIID